GSLGIDLAAAVDVTLIDSQVRRIPTGVTGPIYDTNSTVGALLLGRSSTSLGGLVVLPGVIDADYTGEIQVVAYALQPPLTIKKGTRIAQSILYTQTTVESQPSNAAPMRGDRGFGSTGGQLVNLVQQMKHRPLIPLRLTWEQQNHTLPRVMTDTGADVTIL
ncbi:POK9 protein, partial [Cnemophilus loriae]|nr:POK9 protein [Cnemophilus loriae]